LNGWDNEDSLEMIDEEPWHEKSHDSKISPLDLNRILPSQRDDMKSPMPSSVPDDDLLSPELLEDGWGCDENVHINTDTVKDENG